MNKLNEIIVAFAFAALVAALAEPNVGGGSIRSEVSIEIDGGKVSDIKLSEGFKKGVRFGLEENAEVSGGKIARWL